MSLLIRIVSELAPALSARWAASLFFTPRLRPTGAVEPMPPPDAEYAYQGIYLRRWGRSPDRLFLLHGWEGRYSQFHGLLPPLLAAGFSVLSIDPPAHGRAAGQRSHPQRFAEALLLAAAAEGQPAAVLGHSMGAGAAMLASGQGLRPRALVLFAAPSNVRDLIAGFSRLLGLGRRASQALRERIEHEVGLPLEALDVQSLAGRDDLPPALILHDHDDRRIPVTAAHEIASNWPGADLHLSAGRGHHRLLQDPGLIAITLRYLNDRLGLPAAA